MVAILTDPTEKCPFFWIRIILIRSMPPSEDPARRISPIPVPPNMPATRQFAIVSSRIGLFGIGNTVRSTVIRVTLRSVLTTNRFLIVLKAKISPGTFIR